MSLVLRKVQGKLAPLMRSLSGSFGPAVSPQTITATLLSPFVLIVLAIAFAVAWIMAHGGFAHVDATLADVAVLALPKTLKETQEKLAERQKKLHTVFGHAGADLDLSKDAVLKELDAKDAMEAVEKVGALNDELSALGEHRDKLAKVARIAADTKRRESEPANPIPLPGGTERKERVVKSFGEVVMGSRAMTEFRKSRSPHESIEEGFGLAELKANFLTSAGWPTESVRIPGLVIEKATRPIQVIDIIPAAQTDQATVKYMEETTRTHAAAERAEAAAYAESTFALTERSETVRVIGDSVPVSDEQLADVAGSQSYLEQRLQFGVRQRLDGQIILGDGVAPNLTGIKNKAGIQTQAKGVDSAVDAIYKAMDLVRVTGRAFPNAVIVHPTNWQAIRLLKDANGQYIWGHPAEAGPLRIWGIQVVLSDADVAGTAYVGDYANFCALYERSGMEVAIGYVNAQFTQGLRTIRAGLRTAFAIYRAAAFCTVTGL